LGRGLGWGIPRGPFRPLPCWDSMTGGSDCHPIFRQVQREGPGGPRPVGLASSPGKAPEQLLQAHERHKNHQEKPTRLPRGKSALANSMSFYGDASARQTRSMRWVLSTRRRESRGDRSRGILPEKLPEEQAARWTATGRSPEGGGHQPEV